MKRRNVGSFVWMYVAALVLSALIFGVGVILEAGRYGERLAAVMLEAAGALAFAIVLALGPIVVALRRARREFSAELDRIMAPVNERLQHLSVLLDLVSEQQLISERAKAIAFRDKDREALRRAIREEMTGGDFDAALALAADVENVFGYKQEADQLRSEITKLRDSDMRRDINESITAIDRFCRAEQWTLALREAERIVAIYPKDEQASQIPQQLEARRQQLKKQLLDSWQEAVSRHDVDTSIAILQKLDLYLTPQEAAGMQETARQIFKDKLQLLGHDFTMAVKEHQWLEAVRLGEGIVSAFPNSRMAQEVNEKMGLLKEKAAELTLAKA